MDGNGFQVSSKKGPKKSSPTQTNIELDNEFENIADTEFCLGCSKEVSEILKHLSHKKVCQVHYDMDRLRQEAKQKKAAKNKIEVARYREAARAQNLEGFKAKQAAEGNRSKKAAKDRDSEAFNTANLEAVTRSQQAAKDRDLEAFNRANLEAVTRSQQADKDRD